MSIWTLNHYEIILNMKTKNLIGIQLLFFILVCFVSCDKDEDTKELTPQALYQTSWSGAGYCESWTSKSKDIGIQFVDTQKGIVNWKNYDAINITFSIEGKYITFNSDALYLGGAPWVIKTYTNDHLTLVQNEASPDINKIITLDLYKIK